MQTKSDSEPLIKTEQMSMKFGAQLVLEAIDLKIHAGQILTLIGPNGAGKSTLVRLLLGLLKPSAGTIIRSKQLRVGYMPQKIALSPLMPLTVQRFLNLTDCDSKIFQETIQSVNIENLQQQSVQSLSGGQMQRVLLARALLRRPNLLVLDEPAQGVDVVGQSELYQLIIAIKNKLNCGVLLVSHDLHLVMAGTDTVICLNRHVCCSGCPESVSQHPEFLKLFGAAASAGLAIYTHRHNHVHDLKGEIKND